MSRYGATQEIAERIGEVIRPAGIETLVQPAHHGDEPGGYDGVVIGSAPDFFHWMKQSTNFVRRNRATLAQRPVWLFSSGPLGFKAINDKGRDQREITLHSEIAEFRETIRPIDPRVFFGVMNPVKLVSCTGLFTDCR